MKPWGQFTPTVSQRQDNSKQATAVELPAYPDYGSGMFGLIVAAFSVCPDFSAIRRRHFAGWTYSPTICCEFQHSSSTE
jgi:hypothetical protein